MSSMFRKRKWLTFLQNQFNPRDEQKNQTEKTKEGEENLNLHIFHILRSHHDSCYEKSVNISGIDSKP